ncbi:hypothetical protein MLD52_13380 [Puniceicoccaceae bacterium K14]|nr:hypothetical protein [Puniceicoccaceae bacterium K14]
MKKSILAIAALFSALLFQSSLRAEFYATESVTGNQYSGYTLEVSAYQRVASNEDPDDLEDIDEVWVYAWAHEGALAAHLINPPVPTFDHEYGTLVFSFESSTIPFDRATVYFLKNGSFVKTKHINNIQSAGGWYDPDDADTVATTVLVDID